MNFDVSYLLAKLNTLFTINVYEPISKDELITKLTSNVDISKIDAILAELIKEKRIVEDGNQYRVTYLGLKSIGKGKGRVLMNRQELPAVLPQG